MKIILMKRQLRKNFYVDDCLKSVQNEQDAVRFVSQFHDLLAKGGFRLTNWLSNTSRVIKSVLVSERASCVRNLELDHLPVDLALGVQWDVRQMSFASKSQSRTDLTTEEESSLS